MKNFAGNIPVAFLGAAATIALVQPQIAVALDAASVGKIAKEITVLIEGPGSPGSGALVYQDGNSYYVLTAAHVVRDIHPGEEADVVTYDKRRYQLDTTSLKIFPGVDLALGRFTSTQPYPIARVGHADRTPVGSNVYVSGFPVPNPTITRSIYNFTPGQLTANASQLLDDGYGLVYTNNTLPGMSGGPVLNDRGELIGIHGRGDVLRTEATANPNIWIKTSFNLGVPIDLFLKASPAQKAINVPLPPPVSEPIARSQTDNFFLRGGGKLQSGDYPGAIYEFSQFLRLNPNASSAYLSRGAARFLMEDDRGAIADLTQALRLNPTLAHAYYNRGLAYFELQDYRAALADLRAARELYLNQGNMNGYETANKVIRFWGGS